MDHGYSERAQWIFRWIPFAMWLYRMYLAWEHDMRYFVFIRPVSERARGVATHVAKKHLKRGLRGVTDEAKRAQLLEAFSPKYPIGCKRIITSDDFYPTFARPNVALETDSIQRVVAEGIVVKDGAGGERTVPLDVIVYATGFDVVASVDSLGVTGVGGLTMKRAFELTSGPEAYLGIAAPNFPNLFMMMGPNTGLGHSSMITMIEAQAGYTARVISRARANGWTRVEVRQDVCDAYNKNLQLEIAKNVWGSCYSWYTLQGVKNVVLWPFTVVAYHWRLRSVDWSAWKCAK